MKILLFAFSVLIVKEEKELMVTPTDQPTDRPTDRLTDRANIVQSALSEVGK